MEQQKQASRTNEYGPYDPLDVNIDVVDGMSVGFDPQAMPPFDDHKIMSGKGVNVGKESMGRDKNPSASSYGDEKPWAPDFP
jgi:hypothetical protein